jgi:uncharacterized UPF0160 family protein
MSASKRQKLKSSESTNFVIPDTEFTLETTMSLSLLHFIHPITTDSITFIDPTSDLHPYLYNPHTFLISLGGKYIPQSYAFHWSTDTNKSTNIKSKKNKNKNKKNHVDHYYFNDSRRCKVVPLSTVGLIYKMFGKLIISKITEISMDDSNMNWLFERAYFDYIEIIDAYTRNIRLYNINNNNNNNNNKANSAIKPIPRFNNENQLLPSFVKFYNPQFNELENLNENEIIELKKKRLLEIINILNMSFTNYIKYFAFSFIQGKKIISDAYNNSIIPNIPLNISSQIIILSKFIPWKEHLFNYEKEHGILGRCLYVIFQDSSKSWRISAVPIQPASFESRKKMPIKWRGLELQKLRQVTGVEDAVFVHTQGFIGGAESMEGCLKMAIMSIENKEVDDNNDDKV